jgi:hypothetical protein
MSTLLKRPLYSVTIAFFLPILFSSCSEAGNARVVDSRDTTLPDKPKEILYKPAPIDSASYRVLLDHITNGDSSGRWPVNNSLPPEGAILPFNRIIAYYGNLYSKNMGILGEFPKDSMIGRLRQEVAKWQAADTMVKVIPALHYIAVTAQQSPGPGNTYRLRMPFQQIDKVISWANEINALVFLDVQVGLSDLQRELPPLEKYLSLPNVHLGIDPEFSMKTR